MFYCSEFTRFRPLDSWLWTDSHQPCILYYAIKWLFYTFGMMLTAPWCGVRWERKGRITSLNRCTYRRRVSAEHKWCSHCGVPSDMSNRYYNDLWREAQSLLDETTYADNIQLSSKPSKDRKSLCKQSGIIFTKYALAINKLGECYDQMVHPQKRLLIRRILDCTIIRFGESSSSQVEGRFEWIILR